jgi:hypothetical protein
MTKGIEEFKKATGRPRKPCAAVAVRQGMTAAQRRAYDLALKDPSISSRAISLVVGSWGIQIWRGAVGEHRRGNCACPVR